MTIVTDDIFEQQLQKLINNVKNPNFGLFGPESIMWKIAKETVLFLDGCGVFCLQISHPYIAEALLASKGYSKNPKLRFELTRDYIGDLIFGDLDTVIMIARKIYKIHKSVSDNGYKSNQIDLIIWIASTMIYQHCLLYEKLIKQLTLIEKDLFIKDFIKLLSCFGIDEKLLPNNWKDFEFYYNSKINSDFLVVNEKTIELSNHVFKTYWFLNTDFFKSIAASFLSEKLRKNFGFRHKDKQIKLLFLFIKYFLKILPKSLRYLPVYKNAIKRIQLTKCHDMLLLQ